MGAREYIVAGIVKICSGKQHIPKNFKYCSYFRFACCLSTVQEKATGMNPK